MTRNLQAVIAGSKGFAEALDETLRLRGSGPAVVVSGAEEMLAACGGDRVLLVVEYDGPACLDALRKLRAARDRASLAIVAAVPAARAEELDAVRGAGVDEAVCWSARLEPVAWAVARVLADRGAAADQHGGEVRAAPARVGFAARGLVPGSAPPVLAPIAPLARPPAHTLAPPVVAAAHGAAAVAMAAVAPSPAPAPESVEAELPSDEDLAALLGDALAGVLPAHAGLRQLAQRVAGSLSALERAALTGDELPCDPAPLRTAALLRWRVEAVLERARGGSGPIDAPSAARLPAALDRALQALQESSGAMPAAAKAEVAAIRNALVREAIHLTDALARLAVAPAAPVAAPAGAQPAATRLLSNERDALERKGPRPRSGLAVLFAAVLLATAGYHAYAWWHRPAPPPPRRMGGAPEGLALRGTPPGRVKVLVSELGRPVDPAQLERFRKEQELHGASVRQLAPHVVVVESPDPARPAEKAPPAEKPPAAEKAAPAGQAHP